MWSWWQISHLVKKECLESGTIVKKILWRPLYDVMTLFSCDVFHLVFVTALNHWKLNITNLSENKAYSVHQWVLVSRWWTNPNLKRNWTKSMIHKWFILHVFRVWILNLDALTERNMISPASSCSSYFYTTLMLAHSSF